jgi:hypothetical protein
MEAEYDSMRQGDREEVGEYLKRANEFYDRFSTRKPAFVAKPEPDVPSFHITTVGIDPHYAEALRKGYIVDPVLSRIWTKIEDKGIAYHFCKKDNLLYFRDVDGAERLCIPMTKERDIFEEHHDNAGHPGYHRTYHRIRSGFYIKGLARKLRHYIDLCPACLTHQTKKRHKPWGELQPLQPPKLPFDTICIDFMVGFPVSSKGNNACMSVTCQLSKRIGLIP